MQPKYVGPALLLVTAGLLFAWSQKPSPTADTTQVKAVSPPASAAPDLAPALALLEQRLASLNERVGALEQRGMRVDAPAPDVEELQSRLAALEVQLRRQPTFDNYAEDGGEPGRKSGSYTLDTPDPRIAEVRQAFENDSNAVAARQAALENADSIFERQEVGDLEFRGMDCTEHYCRLSYEDYSADSAASSITENELILLLAEKYGDNIVIHGGQSSGTSKSLYIELGID